MLREAEITTLLSVPCFDFGCLLCHAQVLLAQGVPSCKHQLWHPNSNVNSISGPPMVSAIDLAKRALVALLKTLAGIYSVNLNLTRDSSDNVVRSAYKRVSVRAHPDRGGREEHQKE